MTGTGSSVENSGAVGGIGNLEAIIAATIRAVTGQMGSLGSPTDGNGGVMRGSMDGCISGGYGSSGGHNIGSRWSGNSPMPVALSASATMAAAGDGDPNTLYVGNVSIIFFVYF